ncbi:HypC/HybG/HupF family hydrogenase formation chaperone [Roseateles puraquae]|uniref:Hydrogenase n=1 Tax=Roseateles puraquae TaxID=431059 RepID=A0A254N117_9BURK|nr:HypC/HybG/HupF family hydrogenase formation chaperone [Roseateles puraquae]MDG0854347.1 HypC/HybG/HupF family hydrogenase formation chaperone [Roseateles puraquae]OWR00752.1 hydrogenase [Roseateles puraquae]RTL46781.1 MAG: HypC/HybG/HupF family hydrogenase formation chaperone [Burkholderiales bacterium]
MCIGIPMQVFELEPGHAVCLGRGERRRVRTALVGEPAPGDWLLVFLDSAQERITAKRAAEVNATLDLLAAVQAGEGGGADAAFALPSQLSAHELLALTGANNPTMETTT